MPTILFIKGYRFFFYSNENMEPVHIHVEKAENVAKFWVDPIALADNFGFNSKELKEIGKLIDENKELIINSWNEYFNK